jgi:hypothetical protein
VVAHRNGAGSCSWLQSSAWACWPLQLPLSWRLEIRCNGHGLAAMHLRSVSHAHHSHGYTNDVYRLCRGLHGSHAAQDRTLKDQRIASDTASSESFLPSTLVHGNHINILRLADAASRLQCLHCSRNSHRSHRPCKCRDGGIDHRQFCGPLSYYIRVLSLVVLRSTSREYFLASHGYCSRSR